MIAAFERMTRGVLAVLGEGALFNGVVPCKINIEHDVQFDGYSESSAANRGDQTLSRDVATISNEVDPKINQTFRFTDAAGVPTGATYRLDRYVDTNGYSKRFIVLKVPG